MGTEFLVSQDWAAQHLHDPGVVFLDVRSAHDYWAGHLRGARHFDVGLFAHYDTSAPGLALLAAQYSGLLSLLGIDRGERVVVVEDRSESRAARGAWLLEYLGHPSVSLLDGGLAAAPDLPREQDARPYAARRFVATPQPHLVVGADEIVRRLDDPAFRIVDTRRAAEFHGEEKRARRAGAIPGALHLDYVDNLDAAGRFKPPEVLREQYRALGLRDDDEIVAYCGGGVRAAHTYYALKLAGFKKPRNYTGSWGEWGNSASLPVVLPRRSVQAVQPGRVDATDISK